MLKTPIFIAGNAIQRWCRVGECRNMRKPKLTASGKIFFGTIFLIVLFIVISTFASNSNVFSHPLTTITSTTTTTISPATGRILIGFKDNFPKAIGIGTVTMLNLSVTEVSVRENNHTEWIPLFIGSKTFDIIQFSDKAAIIADTEIPLKNYTQERIVLGTGNIKVYNLVINIFNRTYSLYPDVSETILSFPFVPTTDGLTFLVFDLGIENSIKHRTEGYFISPQFNISSSIFATIPQDSVFIN